jgi:two-component system, cell cycle response regulator
MRRDIIMEIAKNIYWVGHEDKDASLQCNPYLVCDNGEYVLIDPGSVLDFEYVLENVKKHVSIDELDYIVLNHQDADLCSAVPLFEKEGFKGKIALHWRTSLIVHYYGITSEYYLVDEMNYVLTLKSGRVLDFIHTPYLHFPGAIMVYDSKSKTLFSSDLFGAFSNNWQLYADDHYMEAMNTFHEHYMPGKENLMPIMKLLLTMDISLIAPQHGSIIDKKIREHIIALRDLECGTFLAPLKKELFKTGGYLGICNQALKRFYATFSKEEISEIFTGTEIFINAETMEIDDFNCTGEELWSLFFELVYTKKGQPWLNVVEILVKRICSEYEIELPSIYQSTIYSYQKKVEEMSEEMKTLAETNARLETNLQRTKESLFTCQVTKLYNGYFFKSYMGSEIQHALDNNEDLSIFFLEIDEFGRKSSATGDNSGDEILRNCAYLFESLKKETHMVFKLAGATFACYLPSLPKDEGVKVADFMRSELEKSDLFASSITASIGIASLSEVSTYQEDVDEIFNDICDLARIRLSIAKKQGMNIVCSESGQQEIIKSSLGTILIAEADPLNTDIMKTLIEQMGFETITCRDGDTALNLIYTNTPSLVICEEVLPKMDGFQIREKMLLSSVLKTIPFILMGYNKDELSVSRAYSISVNHFLKKPYLPSELLGIIKSILFDKG